MLNTMPQLDRRINAQTTKTLDSDRALNPIIYHPRRYAPRGGSFAMEQVAVFRWTEWQISVEYATLEQVPVAPRFQEG
jgi:hypothetical protein